MYKIKKLPKSQIEIFFEVCAKDLEKFYKEAVLEFGKEIKIEGFRSGHIPEKIIEQKVGKMAILEEAAEEAIRENYQKLISENSITPISQPQVEILPARNASHSDAGGKLALGDDLEFKIRVFVLPEIKLPDYKKIAAGVKRKEISVAEKEVEDSLLWLQKSRAKLSLKNEAAQKGDFVEIEYSSPQLESGKIYKDAFFLGEGHFIEGFEQNLEGVKDGEEKEFTIKDKNFKVKIKSVQKAELPEIGDEFAKSLGKFENIEALRQNIKQGITMEKESKETGRLCAEILDKISEASVCEIPEVLVLSEKKRTPDLPEDQIKKRVMNSLVLREIGRTEDIKVSDEEIKEEMDRFLKQYPLPGRQAGDIKTAENQFDAERLKEYIKDAIINEKTLKLLESFTKN